MCDDLEALPLEVLPDDALEPLPLDALEELPPDALFPAPESDEAAFWELPVKASTVIPRGVDVGGWLGDEVLEDVPALEGLESTAIEAQVRRPSATRLRASKGKGDEAMKRCGACGLPNGADRAACKNCGNRLPALET